MKATMLVMACLPALVALSDGCKEPTKETAKTGQAKAGKGQNSPKGQLVFAAEVMTLQPQPVKFQIYAPGTIEAFERVQVTARVAGAVDRVAFVENGRVTGLESAADLARDRALIDRYVGI